MVGNTAPSVVLISAFLWAAASPIIAEPRSMTASDAPPVFERAPTRQEMTHDFPTTARLEGVSGLVVLRCTVTVQGRLDPCGILSEEPIWYSFGRAAFKVANRYRFRPAVQNGQPAAATIDLPIRFIAPPADPEEERRVDRRSALGWNILRSLLIPLAGLIAFGVHRARTPKRPPLDFKGW